MKNALLLLIATGCASGTKPLAFEAVPYTSVDGQAWKEDRLPLPGIAETYRLTEPPHVAFVELNPDGDQTLLFLHGLGSNLKFWRYQLDTFARAGFRVLAIDMLGYGKSDKPATFPYSMEAMADVVREVVASTDAERPILVGHSMGGHVALTYAIHFPQALSGLVLTSPAGFEKFSKREKAWFRNVFSSSLVKGASEEAIWRNIRRNNFENWRDDFEWLIDERVRVALSPEFDQYAYANVKSVQGLTETDFVRENLAKVTVPTLIIFGDADRLIPNPFMHGGPTRRIMEFGHRGIANSQLEALAGCGHMLQMDCAKTYNGRVTKFLDQVQQGGAALAQD